MTSVAGGPTISGPATATGTVSGNYVGPGGTPATKVSGAPEVPIPDLNPANFCAGANFTLTTTGFVVNNTTGVSNLGPFGGWVWDIVTQTWTGTGTPTLPAAGTYCSQANIWLAGSVGSAAAPKSISLITTKSIRVDGTPYVQAAHPDGILLLAGGDIFMAGNNTTGAFNYQGMVYAGAQCLAQGNAKTYGQLLCANGAQPAGATEYAASSAVSGNFTLNFDCSGNVFNKRRMLYWYPRIGT
jgi:hypothetical protein